MQEFQGLDERLRAATTVLDGLRQALADRAAQAEAWEAEIRRLETSLAALDEAIREHLELKRLRGADPGAVAREEKDALGPAHHDEGVALEDYSTAPGDQPQEDASARPGPAT